jgi:hypothetical protein
LAWQCSEKEWRKGTIPFFSVNAQRALAGFAVLVFLSTRRWQSFSLNTVSGQVSPKKMMAGNAALHPSSASENSGIDMLAGVTIIRVIQRAGPGNSSEWPASLPT